MDNDFFLNNGFKKISCLGFDVFADDLKKITFNRKALINTLNQYSYCITQQDHEFKAALQQSDVLLPDGIGVTFAVKILTGNNIKKIAGADIHKYLLEECNKSNLRCFYLGASNSTLNKIKTRVNAEYPNINVGFYSPPYKPKFTEDDNREMIKHVNEFKPDVLFVGMTAPKQEKWAAELHGDLNTTITCSIGAVFDFYAGTIKRPGKFWIAIGLEWFIRLLKEPKRMSKRYLYYGPMFVWMILKKLFNGNK